MDIYIFPGPFCTGGNIIISVYINTLIQSPMRSLISFLLCLSVSSALFAQNLPPDFTLAELGLKDQHEQVLPNPGDVEWLLVSVEKSAHKLVHEPLNQRGAEWLKSRQLVVLSDISGMPSLITKLFALPKMRKYKYPLYLDRGGELVSSWPKREGQLMLLHLKQGHPVSVQWIQSFDQLQQATESP